ncbi:MAG: AarF/ABC1/UbiB kinase family protein [Candidatus Omnitrophica bacterium]|nr:AarF/ABC1/UbiB kinase family protein [Candidatus Omnitrophota bacterium]
MDHIVRVGFFTKPARNIHAGERFSFETTLDLEYPYDVPKDFRDLLRMPGWQADEVLERIDDPMLVEMISVYLKNDPGPDAGGEGAGTRIRKVLEFIKGKFPYRKRYGLMEKLLGIDQMHALYEEEIVDEDTGMTVSVFSGTFKNGLLDYCEKEFGGDYEKIIRYLYEMFTRDQALSVIENLAERIYEETLRNDAKGEVDPDRQELAIAFFEFIASRTVESRSFTFKPYNVSKYLDLTERKIKRDFPDKNHSGIRPATYRAIKLLTASAPLFVSAELTQEAGKRPLTGEKKSFSDCYYGWNERDARTVWGTKPLSQSRFVTLLPLLTIGEIEELLGIRKELEASKKYIEYRHNYQVNPFYLDTYSDILLNLLIRKKMDANWGLNKDPAKLMDEFMSPSWVSSVEYDLKGITKNAPEDLIKMLGGLPVPTKAFEETIEKYVEAKKCYGSIPEFAKLINPPSVMTVAANGYQERLNGIKKHVQGKQKVPYRDVVSQLARDTSLYSKLYSEYLDKCGEGYVRGDLKPMDLRFEWLKGNIPEISLMRDSIFDLWEADVFPEVLSNSSRVYKLILQLRSAKKGTEVLSGGMSIWQMVNSLEDDMGKIQCLGELDKMPPERLRGILDFYRKAIPQVFMLQKKSRFGAIAYRIWEMLPENKDKGFGERMEAISGLMPEPSVLRDGVLIKMSNKYMTQFEEEGRVTDLLYENNLISDDEDLRVHDFLMDNIISNFSTAGTKARVDILLWFIGRIKKPPFVEELEGTLSVDFSTLPGDLKFMPESLRHRAMEAFMLGDNGVLDPDTEKQLLFMDHFLGEIFDDVFPEGTRGLEDGDRIILKDVFRAIMRAYPPYRRVQVVKTLADLKYRADFNEVDTGDRLAVLLGSLGPVGIKVAQYFSESRTLVPDDDLRRKLGHLRSNAPEIPKLSLMSVLINETPLKGHLVKGVGDKVGVASVKQVNRGMWVDLDKLHILIFARASDQDKRVLEKTDIGQRTEIIDQDTRAGYLLDKAREYGVDPGDARVKVVYKVARPSLDSTLEVDFKAMEAVAREFKNIERDGHVIDVRDLVDTVQGWIKKEKDFRNEARFHNAISRKEMDYSYLSGYEKKAGVELRDPKVYFNTGSVMVEEEVPGVPLYVLGMDKVKVSEDDIVRLLECSKTEAMDIKMKFRRLFGPEAEEPIFQEEDGTQSPLGEYTAEEMDRMERIYVYLLKAGSPGSSIKEDVIALAGLKNGDIRDLLRHMLLHQLFVDGKFHADLHQGNILITPDKGLYPIDRGNVGFINEKQREAAKKTMLGIFLRDAGMTLEGINAFFKSSGEGGEERLSGIRRQDIEKILGEEEMFEVTLKLVSSKAIEGMKKYKGADDFSTVMKAFTQAIYLFPTTMSEGRDTMDVLLGYINGGGTSLQRGAVEKGLGAWGRIEIMRQAESEQRLKQQKDGREKLRKAIMHKVKRYTDGMYLKKWWQPVFLRLAASVVGRTAAYIDAVRAELVSYVKENFLAVVMEHKSEMMANSPGGISNSIERLITAKNLEKLVMDFFRYKYRESPRKNLVMGMARVTIILLYPFRNIIARKVREWFRANWVEILDKMTAGMEIASAMDLFEVLFAESGDEFKDKLISGFSGPTGITAIDIMRKGIIRAGVNSGFTSFGGTPFLEKTPAGDTGTKSVSECRNVIRSHSRVAGRRVTVLMPRTGDHEKAVDPMKHWQQVRSDLKDEYQINNISLRFFDKDEAGSAMEAVKKELDGSPDMYALVYVPDDIYEAHKGLFSAEERFIGVREKFDDDGKSELMINTHVSMALGIITIASSGLENDPIKDLLINEIASLLEKLGDAHGAENVRNNWKSLIDGTVTIKIIPYSEEIEQRMLEEEAVLTAL